MLVFLFTKICTTPSGSNSGGLNFFYKPWTPSESGQILLIIKKVEARLKL